MKQKKAKPKPLHMQPGTFAAEGNPIVDENDLVAVFAGIATSLLIVLANISRMDRTDESYPITAEERELLNHLAQSHLESLVHLLRDQGYTGRTLLFGDNHWNISYDQEHGVVDTWSATEFQASSYLDTTDD